MENELEVLKSDNLADDAMELGKKYLKEAIKASSTKSASLALSVAERAFALSSKMYSDFKAEGSYADFLLRVTCSVSRPKLWLMYLNYCEEKGAIPLPKGQFFEKLTQLDFRIKRTHGDVLVIPPGGSKRIVK
jgi:hypothetical protein